MATEKVDNGKLDRPAASTSSESDVEAIALGEVNEKKLLRTLDLRLLPAVSILYLLSFLDRSNGKFPTIKADALMLTRCSGERETRRSYNRSEDDRQPISDWFDPVLHWLRLI